MAKIERKILDKRSDKHPNLIRYKKGHDPRRGVGVAGRSGRKKNAFKRMCKTVLASPKLKKRCINILRDGADKDVLNMMKTLAEYTQQKPMQKIDATFTSLEDLVAGSRKHD